jgi:WS/DGAT/MGAT family acyltransferase
MAALLPTAARSFGAAARVLVRQRTGAGERSLNLGLAPKTIFNDSVTNQRSFSTLSVPLADLKALGTRVGGTVNTIVMAMCSSALKRFLKERDLLPRQGLIAAVPVSLRAADDASMNNQVSQIRVDLATDIDDLAARFNAIHASSEAAKAVVRELKPVMGVDIPVTGAPWIMTNLASLYGRSNLSRHLRPVANVVISNVPGPAVPLYLAGARIVHYHPVSIPGHGLALNITVQSYAGSLEFGLTACRRVVSQEESYELVGYLQDALDEIRRLPDAVEATPASASATASAPSPAPKSRRPRSKSAAVVVAPKSAGRRTRRADPGSARTH